MASTALVLRKAPLPTPVSLNQADSLLAWFNLYMQLEAAAGAENTAQAKRRDLNTFLDFFTHAIGSDHPDQWTRSLTTGFLKYLEKQQRKSPTTINRCSPPSNIALIGFTSNGHFWPAIRVNG